MPTTNYADATFSASVIGARTDASGSPVSDIAAEELRLPNVLLSEGYVSPASAFRVQAQSSPNMSVRIGSQTAKADHYVVAGDAAGQGNYIIRQDVTSITVDIDAADSSQPRTDEIYLVVQDNVYDASSRGLPRIGYRKGNVGGAAPGPDAAWKASAILARVAVAAGATSITSSNITDLRSPGGLLPMLAVDDSDDEVQTTIPGLDALPRTYALTSDKSSSSTTAVVAFSVPITATGRYLVEAFLHYAAHPNVGMRMSWAYPSNTSGRWSSGGIHSGSRIGDLDLGMVNQDIPLPVSGDSGGPEVEIAARPVAHFRFTNTGTLTFRISQQVAGEFVTTLRAGSILRVTRVSS